jgi:DNA polymerase III delta prime subunit
MVSSVISLIDTLNKLKTDKSYIIESIHNFNLLILALNELDSMIEMNDLKDSIVKQIKFLLINNPSVFNFDIKEQNKKGSIFDGHMLHTVIYGPPGVGKTRVCTILVKIWLALGMIKQPSETSINRDSDNFFNQTNSSGNNPSGGNQGGHNQAGIVETLISLNKIKSEVIDRLQIIIGDIKSQLNNLDPNIQDIKVKLRKLKRLMPSIPQHDIYTHANNKPSNYHKGEIDDLLSAITDIETKIKIESSKYTPEEKIKFAFQIISMEFAKQPISPTPSSLNNNLNSNVMNNVNNLVKIVGREDFVGGFLGQTALKTEKLLKESLGKVLFIDEAYSLANDEKDSYGREALTVLNRFMSEYPDELIVIFAGYREMMEQTIFKLQPGLKSRCTWMFEIDGYTEKGLTLIFEHQLRETGWILSRSIDLEKFFKEYKDDFPAYGRDTNRLVFYCKMCYTETIFDSGSSHDKIITEPILINALKYLRKNRIKDSNDREPIHPHMYI